MGVKFDNTFKLSVAALNLNRGHPSLPLNLKWAAQMFLLYVGFSPNFLGFLYSSIFHDDFPKICRNLSEALVFNIICINNAILIVYKKKINDMIKITEENIESSKKLSSEDELVVKEYTEKGNKAAKVWLAVCIIAGGVLPGKAIVGSSYLSLQGNLTLVPIYDVTWPAYVDDRKNEFYMYLIIFGFQSFYIICICLMFVAFYPLGPIFMLQACGQIELVIRKLGRLFKDDNIDSDETVKSLQDIARHVQDIYRYVSIRNKKFNLYVFTTCLGCTRTVILFLSFVDIIQKTHTALYEMCLKTTTFLIPLSLIGFVESYNQGNANIQLICFVCASGMQCYIPCYYCELLATKGEELRYAIYGCGWERHWVPKTRSTILVMLTRTAHPLGINAVFCMVGMAAFANVCNLAYSIFNVMNAAWN
uniref:Odorant receptor n=1 Tax=Hedya nubiferana TaxID=572853 RepID=A0A223HD27_9NEOP|nr:putative odorant receptor OR41 [Hedya nubiferana]